MHVRRTLRGCAVGCRSGCLVGWAEGWLEGAAHKGCLEGAALGRLLGRSAGCSDGLPTDNTNMREDYRGRDGRKRKRKEERLLVRAGLVLVCRHETRLG